MSGRAVRMEDLPANTDSAAYTSFVRFTSLTPAEYRLMPWKNGLGYTTEVARRPREGEFDWRVSIARVDRDGPFSQFTGFDRVILALDGGGMVLTHDEPRASITLGVLEPWTFSGDWTTGCMLREGPIRDFNVITRRGVFTASVSVRRVDAPAIVDTAAPTTLLYCVDGDAVIENSIGLSRDSSILFERDEGDAPVDIRPLTTRVTLIEVALWPARS